LTDVNVGENALIVMSFECCK